MNRYRRIIEFNHLQDLADELNISEKYIWLLKLINEGKKGSEIARALNLSRSRVDQMYFQYCSWCRKHTGLIYFEDIPPIEREIYESFYPIPFHNSDEYLRDKVIEFQNSQQKNNL